MEPKGRPHQMEKLFQRKREVLTVLEVDFIVVKQEVQKKKTKEAAKQLKA